MDLKNIIRDLLNVPDSSLDDSAPLLKPHVSDRKTQIQQITVDIIQRLPFLGLQPSKGGSLKMNGVQNTYTKGNYIRLHYDIQAFGHRPSAK